MANDAMDTGWPIDSSLENFTGADLTSKSKFLLLFHRYLYYTHKFLVY